MAHSHSQIDIVPSSQKLAKGSDYSEVVIGYLVFSPERGPEQKLYGDEAIQASGGIHAIERVLEQESYWFVRLGHIRGESGPTGVTFHDSQVGILPTAPENVWGVGRRNPAFGKSELERHVFKDVFRTVERMLDAWKQEEDGVVDAYALKELKISSERLGSLTRSLQVLPKVHEIAEITVIKYWYDRSWPEPHLPCDMVLAEYSLRIPLQLRRSAGQKLLCVEVMPMALC